MAKEHLGLILVAALGMTAFAAVGGYTFAASNYPKLEQYPVYSEPSSGQTWPLPPRGPEDSKSAQKKQPCHAPQSREESDLCAQWVAANAARQNTIWTERQFWVGVLTALGLGLTIVLTFRAVRSSEESLAHAREVAEIELRPYVFFGDAKLSLPFTINSAITIPIKNHGLTPAFNLRVGIGEAIAACPIEDQSRSIDIDGWISTQPLGPNDRTTYRSGFEGMIAEEIEAVLSGSIAILWRIVIQYEGRNGLSDTVEATIFVDKTTTVDGDVLILNEWARYYAHERFADDSSSVGTDCAV